MSEALESLHPTLRELLGQTIVDRYTVHEVLGVGGMGAVFSGHHLGLKRDVAIKVLHPELTRDPEISKRFDREAHSASRLDHPNCLRVTDVGSTKDGLKFMVMDLLSGGELADRVGEPMAPDRAVLMTIQVLRGLEHAHEHGVVHRDIKPENIFVTRDHDGREVLKLVDFGIAKLVGGNSNNTRMTKAGLIFGTPAYMSPEQAMGMEADVRADLYAVGVILYEMLKGSPPFSADDPVKLVRMQVSKDPPPLPDDIPHPLVAIVMKLLSKDRDERFQTATETREALEQIIPLIASSDIISGVSIVGSTTSGPIVISNPASGPFPIVPASSSSIALARSAPTPAPGESSGAFVPSALPTLPPGGGALKRPPNRLPLIGGAAVVVLAVAAWLASGSGDDPVDDGQDTAAAAAEADGDSGSPPAGDDAMLIVEDAPDEERLAEIDQLIADGKLNEAQDKLDPMLDEYPKNAILAWRQGRLHAKRKKSRSANRAKALASYGDAVEANHDLLEDPKFIEDLRGVLLDPKMQSEATDFALRKMGRPGHTILLELVNNEKNPLGYNDRQRALEELATVDANASEIDRRLNTALNLRQAARKSPTPCGTFSDALEAIAADPDYWYLPWAEKARLPKAKTGDDLSKEDQADALKCEGLDARRDEVITRLQVLAPAGDTDGDELVIDGDEPSGSKGSGSKGSGSKGSGSKGSGSKGSGSKGSGSKGSGSKGSGNKKPIEKLKCAGRKLVGNKCK